MSAKDLLSANRSGDQRESGRQVSCRWLICFRRGRRRLDSLRIVLGCFGDIRFGLEMAVRLQAGEPVTVGGGDFVLGQVEAAALARRG